MKKEFFRRNTKVSIQNEYKLPPLINTVIWLDFTQTEMMMYEAFASNNNLDKYDVKLRQICCHPQIVDELKYILENCKTLEEIESKMSLYYKNDADKKHDEVLYADYKIKCIEERIKYTEAKVYKSHLKKHKIKIIINIPKLDPSYVKLMLKIKNKEIEIDEDEDQDEYYNKSTDDEEIIYKKNIIYEGTEQNKLEVKKEFIKLKKELPETLAITNLEERKNNYVNKYNILNNEWKGKIATCNYFTDVQERLKNIINDDDDNTEDCIICMDVIKKNDLGVTKCGHIYCYCCILEVLNKVGSKCPLCSKILNKNDLHRIVQIQPKVVTKEITDKHILINNVGTKLANLIEFLKKRNKHAIIFSQWDDLLHKVGKVLADAGIKNVFCKGNIWQRSKTIKDFNENDNIKVIMLSSESSASGTNLTKAEIVILLDPVYGTYEFRRNTEWQAIGRAYRMGQTKNVEVVRFLIKSTIEETIFNENINNDSKLKLMPTF
jgi:SNF2 family DNA or RNA helicase